MTVPKIVSVDDHVVEPAHVWQTWLPEKHRAKGPRVERRRWAPFEKYPGAKYSNVEDPDGDPLTVTWRVDGVVVEVDNVPAGGPPTSANVTLVHVFGLGTHTVEVTVSDPQGLVATCVTTVTIIDTRAPVLTCSAAQQMLWPPNHDLVNVGFRSQAADACDPGIVPVVQVFADEDDEHQTGDGHHSPDAKNIAVGTLSLRGADRVLRLAWTVADLAGHAAPTRADVGAGLALRTRGYRG